MRAILAALALALALSAPAAQLPPAVRTILDRAGVPASAVGVVVQPLDQAPAAVSHNAGVAFNPASVMKVLTTAAALDLLGPAFTFRTDFLATAELAHGVLEGDLHIRGGGDPKLTYERLWQVFLQLRSRGVREIRGDFVVDRTYFAAAPHDPAAFDKESRRAYNVGADALLVNYNAVTFRFMPDGQGVRVFADPDLPNLEVTSRMQATAEPCRSYRGGIAYEVAEMGLLSTIDFSGTYPTACGERSWSLAVLAPSRFAEAHLRWLWSQVGGVLRGAVREGAVPEGARLLLRYESEPLASLIRDMNKHSNNVIARHLFLALSAEPTGRGGEERASARRMAEWLRGRRIEAPGVVVENGSGLSRIERASAATLAAVLRDAWSAPTMPELVSSLPVLAVDGTLRTRRSGGSAGRAHLKGGTLNDVQAIAGYVLDRDGRRWVVVMVINHARAGAAQAALDAIVDWTHDSATRESRGTR